MVRLVYAEDPRSVCAGVLVDDDTVVTVAHCVNGISASQLQVLVGDYDLTQVDSGEELVPVTSVELSRNYAHGRRGNDFAVIKLARSIVFTPTKMAACLPDPNAQVLPQGNPKSQCFVAGWGITERRQVSSRLRIAPVRLLDLGTCNAIVSSISGRFDEIPSDMICTDTAARRTDACLYDDGGSLTCRDANGRFTLLGLVSEYSCGSLPTLYTRVDNYTSAIVARL
ncbi:unnamed protein product [Lymnaea stagnalis]|uniref:Peptidase S1 domain-containing protein n=1 Tax=Lymnaea stagnalis TaxID=6523 RepID=A0AAV2HUT0_LYMST